MVEHLKIENLALMKSACVEFERGFTAVTGETGAGKSVLLGALSMLAGNRFGREIVGNTSDICRVEAIFTFADTSKIDKHLEEMGLPLCEENSLVLCRTISKTRAGRAFVNGSPSPLSALASLGKYWVDFHGAGEPQKLFSPVEQLRLLDAFARDASDVKCYRDLLARRESIISEIESLKNSERLSADEVEFYRNRIAKIDAVNPTDEHIEEIEKNAKIASKSGEIADKSSQICSALSGDGAASDFIARAVRLSSELSGAGKEYDALSERLLALSVELSDISDAFESLASECDLSTEDIERANSAMSDWLEICRKYGGNPQSVRATREEMSLKIASQGDVEKRVLSLEEEANVLLEKLRIPADKIYEARVEAAKKLDVKIEKLLESLGFKRARFSVAISKTEEPSKNCGSLAEYLFSANAGQPLMPLSKIASSGELARVMLAIKTELAACDDTPLLVFDEVDANVGGEVGAKIGSELSKLSLDRQVLCITHLPQVAARAQNHLLVEKTQTDTETHVKISVLSRDGMARVKELARMLGDRNSESALAHARKLLEE